MKNMRIDANEVSVASALPYRQQISHDTVITDAGDYVSTLQLHGVSFDTMSNALLDSLNSGWLNTLNGTLASPNHACWTHIVRTRQKEVMVDADYDNYFSQEFMKAYNARLESASFFSNRLYISPVYRFAGTRADRAAMPMMSQKSAEFTAMKQRALDMQERFLKSLAGSLKRYHVKQLATYTSEYGYNTELGEFYAHLLNHGKSRIALQAADFSRTLQKEFLDFGRETIRIVHGGHETYAAVLTMVAPYTCDRVNAKVHEPLLTADFEFVLSQSFTTTAADSAERMLKAQLNRVKSTSANEIQSREIDDALRMLQAGKFRIFDHEWILVVYADSIKALNNHVSDAIELMGRKSVQISREIDGPLIATFFSIFPGNFKHARVRARPISSPVMAKFFPLHNFPNGNRIGSQWGEPILVLNTDSKNPYYVNLHINRDRMAEQGIELNDVYDAEDPDATNRKAHRKELGNYFVIGEAGSGKTTLKGALRVGLRRKQSEKNKTVKIFAFDKDNGEEILMRAMGAEYYILEPGKPCGINPFQWMATDSTKEMIFGVAKWAAMYETNYMLTSKDVNDLKRAIEYVFEIDVRERRFAKILESLPTHAGNQSLFAALHRWTRNDRDPRATPYGWVLDSPEDRLQLKGGDLFGFDMTAILALGYAKTPLMRMITEKILNSAKGSPHVIDIAEAWAALDDPLMGPFIEDQSRTIRKQDGVMGLDTQNADDIIGSMLGAKFLNQFPTAFILPNARAKAEVYIDGLGLTPRELELVRSGKPENGDVLIKKGTESIMAKLNLAGMNDMLSVLSSSADNVKVCRETIEEFGADPKVWLPHFLKRRV